MARQPTLRRYGIYLLLAAVVVLAYLPVYKNGFVYDDVEYITGNQHVQHGLSLAEVRWAFTSMHASNWHPLTWISHMVDGAIYGPNPAGHHVTNLIIHVANVLLLCWLLTRITGAVWPSAFVAALFGVHPLHVESVAWVAERKDVLSTFFWLLTMLAYTRYAERPHLKRYALVVGLFILGLASKPMLVTLPFVLLLMDYWPLGRMKTTPPSRLVIEKLPLLVLSMGSSAITYIAQKQGGALATTELYPMAVRIPNALVAYVSYILKMVWPVKLAAFYPHPGTHLPVWEVVAAGVTLVLLTVILLRAGRKRPYLAVGWLWYVGTLVPVIGIVQVGNQALADRYTYIPLIGLFIAITWAIADSLKGKQASAVAGTAACAVIVVFVILTRLQIRYWHDDIALYRRAIAVTNNNVVAHLNLGVVLDETDRNAAIREYHEALKIAPDSFLAHHNLGSAYAEQGKLGDAIAEFRIAVKLHPNYFEAYNDLGTALMHRGRLDEAYENMTRALEINPQYPEAHNNLGMLLDDLGQTKQAMEQFQAAIDANPEYMHAHYNLGICFGRMGRNQEALEEYGIAVQLDPTSGPAHLNYAVSLFTAGDYGSAWREVHLAVQYGEHPNPDFLHALSQKMSDPLSG